MKGKLTAEQVNEIPNMLLKMNQRALAKHYNVTLGAISYWVKRFKKENITLNKWNKGIIIKNPGTPVEESEK